MPTDKDLFEEERSMVAMSFGDHIEELRLRLILALLGLAVGVLITFVPPLNLGFRVMRQMEGPAEIALDHFYTKRASERALEAEKNHKWTQSLKMAIPAEEYVRALERIAPDLKLPKAEAIQGKEIEFPVTLSEADLIRTQAKINEKKNPIITLAPLEGITIFFMVCLTTGLVIASPWVFYQIWAFIAAGLYKHERAYVNKFLPISLGLFLSGVMICFFGVLPVTLSILLEFNVMLGIEPSLRLTDWMGFATILPVVFGVCFETPLVMLILERIGILSVDDFRSKRKYAILIIVVAAALLTPGPDVFSQCMLAVPMIGLYELGIVLIARRPGKLKESD